jgi:hypothetical protein
MPTEHAHGLIHQRLDAESEVALTAADSSSARASA